MFNIKLINFRTFGNDLGQLLPIEGGDNIGFDIKRIYYIYEVKENERRGFHSHKDLKQLLICLHGSVKILCKTPIENQVIILDKPSKGLYIGEMVWREMFDFSADAVLLVLASKHFDENDYIRDYELYLQEFKKTFGGF